MAVLTGPRIRTNNVFGTVSDNPLTNVATTLNSAGLADLAAVSSAHAVIVLDPLRAAGAPEIVIVTAHTGSATSATITRGAYGTSARQHAAGTLWVHAPTIDDMIRIFTSSTRPTDVYEGQLGYETDTNRLALHDGVGWFPGGLVTICTSSTRPTAPFEGQRIFETDTNRELIYDGSAWVEMGTAGAWTAFTPTVKFGATTATVASDSRYVRSGRLIVVNYAFRFTNLNGGTGVISMTQPVAPKAPTGFNATYFNTYGGAAAVDISSGNVYHHFLTQNAPTDLTMRSPASPAVTMTQATPFAVAVGAAGTGDEVYATAIYEAAA